MGNGSSVLRNETWGQRGRGFFLSKRNRDVKKQDEGRTRVKNLKVTWGLKELLLYPIQFEIGGERHRVSNHARFNNEKKEWESIGNRRDRNRKIYDRIWGRRGQPGSSMAFAGSVDRHAARWQMLGDPQIGVHPW